jgi:hypothetical protein
MAFETFTLDFNDHRFAQKQFFLISTIFALTDWGAGLPKLKALTVILLAPRFGAGTLPYDNLWIGTGGSWWSVQCFFLVVLSSLGNYFCLRWLIIIVDRSFLGCLGLGAEKIFEKVGVVLVFKEAVDHHHNWLLDLHFHMVLLTLHTHFNSNCECNCNKAEG